MSTFKCKMCGGNIEFEQGATVGVCDSCGTRQTLPRLDDDRRANLYDRANHFRRNNEFDKAAGIYEQILNEDPSDAEAYWSLVLCQYGIEYVEDPATHKRVPTVNRAQFTSIFDDDNYRSALQYADVYQRAIYEQEAKAINEIQKGILAISQKEEPFDVFICYKETDNNGRRSPDSVLANDLYHQLIQEGFKVFFARITLEDKLGAAYEPYIFAALNSARVMVVLGTRPEYFNAVWVKNEWSRYLALVKKSGGKKILIPAYRDMDPYDLPEEFSHLQAQDMSKLGFMQDLIRGIKKLVDAEAPAPTVKETVVVGAVNAKVAPLLERAFLFLEDGKWQDANIYCEKVLDIDPKNAQAYLGKLMVDLQVRSRKQLADCAEPFDDRENYGKVLRFGDEKLETEMRGYIAHINERKEETRRKMASIARALKCGVVSNAGPTLNEQLADAKTRIERLENVLKVFSPTQAQIQDLQKQLNELSTQEKQLTSQLSRLGLFSGREKKRIRKELADVEARKNDLSTRLNKEQNVIERYKTIAEVENDLNDAKDSAASIEAQITAKRAKGSVEYTFDEALKMYLHEPVVAKAVNELYPAAVVIPALYGKKDFFEFGRYVQQKNGRPEPIEWIVLAEEDNKVLIISRYALDFMQYNTLFTSITWKDCSLRKWLNKTFLDSAFSLVEQNAIINSLVVSDANSVENNSTTDKVFLLSITEVNEYFSSNDARQCQGTAYCYSQRGPQLNNGNCWWWLRSPGKYLDQAATVDDLGSVSYYGGCVSDNWLAVRPAMWISLD